jgi:hypothetical protein
VIDENDLQLQKQFDPRILTFLWIKIDSSDENKNVQDVSHSHEIGGKFDR